MKKKMLDPCLPLFSPSHTMPCTEVELARVHPKMLARAPVERIEELLSRAASRGAGSDRKALGRDVMGLELGRGPDVRFDCLLVVAFRTDFSASVSGQFLIHCTSRIPRGRGRRPLPLSPHRMVLVAVRPKQKQTLPDVPVSSTAKLCRASRRPFTQGTICDVRALGPTFTAPRVGTVP